MTPFHPAHNRFERSQRGQGVIEYALVLGLIALLVIVLLNVVGSKLSGGFCQVTSGLGGGGCNLVVNGDGTYQSNANFSQFTYDSSAQHSGHNSFRDAVNSDTAFSDAYIAVDTSHAYVESAWADSTVHAVGAHAYLGLAVYDVDKQTIYCRNVSYQSGTTTTLAAPLHAGDTTVSLSSAANWLNAQGGSWWNRALLVWNYADSTGYTYPAGTYSRNVVQNAWADGGINYATNTITLSQPWVGWGSTIPAGTAVSNGLDCATYEYGLLVNGDIPNAWTNYTATIGPGVATGGVDATALFRPATRYVRFLALLNRDVAGNTTNLADISLIRQ